MSRPGYSLYLSPDQRLARNAVEGALAAHPPANGGQWQQAVYWGDEPLPDLFWENLTMGGLFAEPRALVVLNAQNLPAAAWKRVSESLAQPRDAWAHFVFTVSFERGQPKVPAHIAKLPFYRFAEKQNWLWYSQGLDMRSLQAMVVQHSRSLGLKLTEEQMRRLLPRLPLDAASVTAELEKLSLAASPDGYLPDVALSLAGQEPEIDVFAIIRILQQGSSPERVWKQVLGGGAADAFLFPFLSMLTRESRQLWQLFHGEAVRLPGQVLTEKTTLARSLGTVGISRLWRLALEADKGVKSGERSAEQALEMLLSGLLILFRRERSR